MGTTPSATLFRVGYMSLFFISGIACFASVPRARSLNDDEMRFGLVGLLATTGSWAMLMTGFFLVPDPFRKITYIVGLSFGFATVWAWLYFASVYTGRTLHANTVLRRISVGVFLTVVALKATNSLHTLYFTTTEMATPFRYLAINHGPIHWASLSMAYGLSAIGLFMILEQYMESEYETRPLVILTGLLALPVTLDLVAIAVPQVIHVTYSPIGVAGFAIGTLFMFGDEFLAARETADEHDVSVILDNNDHIQGYSQSAGVIFPELTDAIGEQLADVLPEVAATRDRDGQIAERDSTDQSRYYRVSHDSMALGDSTVQVLSLSDVTEDERQRRRLVNREREVEHQNELYRAIIAASFAFVFRIDLDGRFSFVSESVEEFLGYEPAELIGEPMSVLEPDEQTMDEAEHLQQITDGNSIHVRDLPVETHAGETNYLDMRLVPVYDARVEQEDRTPTDIIGAQAMVRDASKRQQRKGLISVINRVLRHNVRNELNLIDGHAQMLAADLTGEAESSAENIVRATSRLLDLTESARRIEANRELSPELEPMDLDPVVSASVTKLEERYPDVTVTTEITETAVAETLPRMETALWELLENAAEHTGSEPEIELTVMREDEQIVITISDDGPGIPESERQVLASGKEEPLVHGQGLGLWLVYWIITNLGGEITIPDTQSGTTIEIRLPSASATIAH